MGHDSNMSMSDMELDYGTRLEYTCDVSQSYE